jgi:hypothetical protein
MSGATVELDVFSGRPNPQWSLSESALASLMQEVALLDTASQSVSLPQNLGYRGLRVVASSDNAPDWQLFIGGGHAFLKDRNGIVVRVDDRRRIERRILLSGEGVVDDGLLQDILTSIGRG